MRDLRYSYQVYTNAGIGDTDYYMANFSFSYRAAQMIWLPAGEDYQGYLCVL